MKHKYHIGELVKVYRLAAIDYPDFKIGDIHTITGMYDSGGALFYVLDNYPVAILEYKLKRVTRNKQIINILDI